MRRRTVAGALAVLLLPVTACSGDDGATLTVLAASSLTETFTALGREFEARHPGVRVRLAFDSSATLAQQAVDGAPADVLATADLETMRDAEDALARPAEVFATNTMVLVTPPDDPGSLSSFADLDRAGVTYVVCVDTAPCGRVAAALLEAEGITRAAASLEPDVKAVLAKVTEREADAGLVFRTDAVAAGDRVREIPVPGAEAQVTSYAVATLRQSGEPDLAAEFVDLVLGAEGRRVLAEAGFGDG